MNDTGRTAIEFDRMRDEMVAQQLAARGVRSKAVLGAMGRVRREGYVPSYLGEFAYDDSPLPIEEEQTISQPLIVAVMIEALELCEADRVLEIGTGSGYAAAVLGEIAAEVHSVERHERLARTAAERLAQDGYENVHVHHADGTRGWPAGAPYDAIVVAAGGPRVPPDLRMQLAVGGRLVIPVGEEVGSQELLRITRVGTDRFEQRSLGAVRFVPLVGDQGWSAPAEPRAAARADEEARVLAAAVEPFAGVDDADLGPLLERIGDARVVLIGEATHGTSEFYRFRARLTRELILRRGFRAVAAEADWPDAARIDHYVRDRDVPPLEWRAFSRFPTWMWRNRETAEFVDWLRDHNAAMPRSGRTRFAGLDLYGLYNSIDEVLRILDGRDAGTAESARERYGCLTPWQSDPAAYGRAALEGFGAACEHEVMAVLEDLQQRRAHLLRDHDGEYFDLVRHAVAVADAEVYYRIMYHGSRESWNLRDRHMADTLESLLEHHGPHAKAVVWAHNSHVGDARATEMASRGELNLGQLVRERMPRDSYVIGFGTDRGTVAAASHWGGPMELKTVRPSHPQSYEALCHATALPAFLLPLARPHTERVVPLLERPRLERAIGVVYRPETERASHYFESVLPRQFDEYVWIDATTAVEPLPTHELSGLPETYPFGL
jgi:protein-L-isoaspartate(D-aspartate) O-methyltransferase